MTELEWPFERKDAISCIFHGTQDFEPFLIPVQTPRQNCRKNDYQDAIWKVNDLRIVRFQFLFQRPEQRTELGLTYPAGRIQHIPEDHYNGEAAERHCGCEAVAVPDISEEKQ